MPSLDTAFLPEEFEKARALRQRFSTCCKEIADAGCTADVVAAAMTSHVAETTNAALPPAASLIWQARITRPLKTDADKPLTPRIVSAIRSWPSARVCDLAQALVEIEACLVDNENEIFHEVIYAEISRAYS